MTRWMQAAFLAAGAAILVLLVLRLDRAAVIRVVTGARPGPLLAAAALTALNVVVKGVRWQTMVRRLSGRSVALGAAVPAILAGVAAASISPARAIDLAKPLLLRRSHGTPLAVGTAAVMVERLFDGIALVVLFGFSLLALPLARDARFQPVVAAAGLLLAAGSLTLAAPRGLRFALRLGTAILRPAPRAQSAVRRTGEAFIAGLAAWRAGRALWMLVALSVAAAALEAGRLAALAAAVGAHLAFTGAMLVFSAANLVAIAALIPGGIGVTELTMAASAGVVLGLRAGDPVVASLVLLDRVLSYYLIVGIGAMVLAASGRGEEVLRNA